MKHDLQEYDRIGQGDREPQRKDRLGEISWWLFLITLILIINTCHHW